MFESFNKFTETINEAKAQYMIGDKEASREDVLSYMFSNPKKPLGSASYGTGKFPKWVQSNSTPDGDTITWSTIKKDMKTLEKEYGKGNVVVSGNTNGGDPVVEIYMKSQNESVVNEAKAITDRDIKVGNSFKIGSSTFKVIKIYKDPKFGNVVNTERYTNNKKAGEYTDTLKDFVDFLNEEDAVAESVVTEAKMSKIHKAAKQGSYPAVIVVVQDGKVIHQEPVSTPEVAPATFNVMQEKYPKALLHLEDNTGKRLFSESVVNEASKDRMVKQIERALKDGMSIFKLPMATQKYYIKNKSDFEAVTEGKIKYSKGKTYQSDGHWTVYVDSNSSGFDIRVNHSAGWRLDPQDVREETLQLLDNGRQRATLNFKSGNIDKFAQEMFDLNDRTSNGNQTKLTAKDYADIIRVWIDMKMANESVVAEEENPCWDDYEVGDPKTKVSSKTGKRVNNCVPKNEEVKEVTEGKFDDIADLTKALHFETDEKRAEEMKLELGKRQGEATRSRQIAGGDYSLRRFRKEIKFGDGTYLGVFLPGSYDAATSTLGDGPHKKAVKKIKWTQKKYDQWLEDVASNDGWKNASDMAQNAKNEPGLIDWVKKNNRGEDALQRIQWDIEAFAESVVTESKPFIITDFNAFILESKIYNK